MSMPESLHDATDIMLAKAIFDDCVARFQRIGGYLVNGQPGNDLLRTFATNLTKAQSIERERPRYRVKDKIDVVFHRLNGPIAELEADDFIVSGPDGYPDFDRDRIIDEGELYIKIGFIAGCLVAWEEGPDYPFTISGETDDGMVVVKANLVTPSLGDRKDGLSADRTLRYNEIRVVDGGTDNM